MNSTPDNFNIRATTEADREKCAAWIEADPDHQGKVTADFFLPAFKCDHEFDPACLLCVKFNDEEGYEKFVWESVTGEPIFYFRLERALRVHIQFRPATNVREKAAIAEALEKGFGWLQHMARNCGYRQIIFDSKYPPLIRFCRQRLGFQQSPQELVCGIEAPKPKQAQEKALHDVQR